MFEPIKAESDVFPDEKPFFVTWEVMEKIRPRDVVVNEITEVWAGNARLAEFAMVTILRRHFANDEYRVVIQNVTEKRS